jgi:hypothetical protein
VTDKPYGLRDRIAVAVCNWVLQHVASERYQKMVDGSIRYGLALVTVEEEDRPLAFWDEDLPGAV